MTLEAFAARLSALARGAPDALERAVIQTADAVCADARQNAPVETGALRAGIARETIPGGARVVSEAPYSAAVELGALMRPAQPFLAPAFSAHTGDIADALRDFLREVL